MKTIKQRRYNAPRWRRASCHSYWLERRAVLCVEETRRPFAGWSSPPQWVAAASAGSHARLENSRWARRSPLKTPHNDELSTKHIDTTVTSHCCIGKNCPFFDYDIMGVRHVSQLSPPPKKMPIPTKESAWGITRGSLGPPEFTTKVASRLVHPFLQAHGRDQQTMHRPTLWQTRIKCAVLYKNRQSSGLKYGISEIKKGSLSETV